MIIKRSFLHNIAILHRMGNGLCCCRRERSWRYDLRPDVVRQMTSQFSKPLADFPIQIDDFSTSSGVEDDRPVVIAQEEAEPRLLE